MSRVRNYRSANSRGLRSGGCKRFSWAGPVERNRARQHPGCGTGGGKCWAPSKTIAVAHSKTRPLRYLQPRYVPNHDPHGRASRCWHRKIHQTIRSPSIRWLPVQSQSEELRVNALCPFLLAEPSSARIKTVNLVVNPSALAVTCTEVRLGMTSARSFPFCRLRLGLLKVHSTAEGSSTV